MKKKTTELDPELLESPEESQTNVTDFKDPSAEQEEIFQSGRDGHYWRGKKLNPYSFERRRAANLMGLRFQCLDPDEITVLQTAGHYRGIDTDVIIVLWLCSVPGSEVCKARRLPDQAVDKAFSWAEKEHVEPGNEEFAEAAKFMLDTYVELRKSRGQYEPADGKKAKGSKRPN